MTLMKEQARMFARGFYHGAIDGKYGRLTLAGLTAALDRLDEIEPVAEMRTSPKGIAALAAHEGVVPGPYLDSKGIWTFGIGHTASAGDPDPVGMARGMPADLESVLTKAFRVFASDLAMVEARVRSAITVPIDQHEFDAAVSFDFNTGGIMRAEWVKSLNRGDRDTAAVQIMNWRTPFTIIDRRKAEQALFRDGIYPAKDVPVWRVNSAGKVIWQPIMNLGCDDVLERLASA